MNGICKQGETMICLKKQMYLMLVEDLDEKGCDLMDEQELTDLHELVTTLNDIDPEERKRINSLLTWEYMESRFYKYN
jgi:uncharacterized protein YfkK (UPF0435 family)